jgi:hypothetical protein
MVFMLLPLLCLLATAPNFSADRQKNGTPCFRAAQAIHATRIAPPLLVKLRSPARIRRDPVEGLEEDDSDETAPRDRRDERGPETCLIVRSASPALFLQTHRTARAVATSPRSLIYTHCSLRL